MNKQYLELVRQKILQHPYNFSDATLFSEILSLKGDAEIQSEIQKCVHLDDLIICVFKIFTKLYHDKFLIELKRLERIVETNVWVTDIHNLFLPLIQIGKQDRISAAKIYIQIITIDDPSHFYQLKKFGKLHELLLDFTYLPEKINVTNSEAIGDEMKPLNSLRDEIMNLTMVRADEYFDIYQRQKFFEQWAKYEITQKLMQFSYLSEMTLFLLKEYISRFPQAFDHEFKLIERMRKVKRYIPHNQFMIFDLSPLNRVEQEFDLKLLEALENLILGIKYGKGSLDDLNMVTKLLRKNILCFKNSPETLNYQIINNIKDTKTTFLNNLRRYVLSNRSDVIEYLPCFLIFLSASEFHILSEWIDQLIVAENYDEITLMVFKMYLEHDSFTFRADFNLLRWISNSKIGKVETTYCDQVDDAETANLWMEMITQPEIPILKKLHAKIGRNLLGFKPQPVCYTKPTSKYNLSDSKSYREFVKKPSTTSTKPAAYKQSTDPNIDKILRETIERSKHDTVGLWRPLIETISFDELFEKFDVLIVADPNFLRLKEVMDVFANHGIIVYGKSEVDTISLFAQDLRAMAKVCFNSTEAKKYLDNVSYETKIAYADELDTFKSIYLADSDLDWTDGSIYSAIESFIEDVIPHSIERYIPPNCDIKQVILDLTQVLN